MVYYVMNYHYVDFDCFLLFLNFYYYYLFAKHRHYFRWLNYYYHHFRVVISMTSHYGLMNLDYYCHHHCYFHLFDHYEYHRLPIHYLIYRYHHLDLLLFLVSLFLIRYDVIQKVSGIWIFLEYYYYCFDSAIQKQKIHDYLNLCYYHLGLCC